MPDHPRSRGVYVIGCSPPKLRQGSSPLARGLLTHGQATREGWGIIPARAGFTTSWPTPSSRPGDHPRSRGVYVSVPVWAHTRSGSSPLARGLHPPPPYQSSRERIIPARAGFTLKGMTFPNPGPDHPRSRGVYSSSHERRNSRVGSSPLARGLPGQAGPQLERERIIPARAGFTPPPSRPRPPWPDHPRSRGVYPDGSRKARRSVGSSPLARGLPQDLGN